jgi:hypothetical protein
VACGIDGVFTDSSSDFEIDFYTELVSLRLTVVDRSEWLARDIFNVIWMGEPADVSRVVLADVALPLGWPLARAHAKRVAPEGPAETALARAVDLVL